MELNKEQVNRIDQFLKDQKVSHLDLRLELIDHLSTEIEDHLKRVTIKSFDEAFILIKRKYTTGLLKSIAEQKYKSLNKYWNRRFGDFWKSYFTLPKITITFLPCITFFSISDISFRKSSVLVLINIALCRLGFCIPMALLTKSIISKSRLMIIESYCMALMGPFLLFNIAYQIPRIWDVSPTEATWYIILLSFTNAIFVIAIVGNITSFRHWINSEIEKTYPLIKSIN